MSYKIRDYSSCDLSGVVEVFNHYVKSSFAAYPEKPVEESYFKSFFENTKGLPALVAESSAGEIIGFGALSWHHRAVSFRRSANLTYFLKEEWLRKGIGSAILSTLFKEGREAGIEIVLASISSLNEISIGFHKKHGFNECGLFRGIGRKFGQDFDVLWMQKSL